MGCWATEEAERSVRSSHSSGAALASGSRGGTPAFSPCTSAETAHTAECGTAQNGARHRVQHSTGVPRYQRTRIIEAAQDKSRI